MTNKTFGRKDRSVVRGSEPIVPPLPSTGSKTEHNACLET